MIVWFSSVSVGVWLSRNFRVGETRKIENVSKSERERERERGGLVCSATVQRTIFLSLLGCLARCLAFFSLLIGHYVFHLAALVEDASDDVVVGGDVLRGLAPMLRHPVSNVSRYSVRSMVLMLSLQKLRTR